MNHSPCVKNGVPCIKRHVGCQGKCKDYADYYAENRAREAEKRKQFIIYEYVTDQIIKREHRDRNALGGRNR